MAVEKDVRLELGKLPAELREHYEIIYQDILESAPSTSSIARKTFSWILASQRMLTVEEMIAAVALDDDGFYHSDLDIARLLDICRNLVIVTSIDYASKQMAFQMVHLSVREYLEELPEFSAEQVHTVVISRLLSNFNSSAHFEKDILVEEKPLRALRDYTIYLFKHAEMSLLATSECDLAPKMSSFLFDNQYNNTPMLNEWHHIVDEFRERSILTQDSPGSLTMRGFNGLDAGGLYLVCRHGLLSILQNLDHDEINPWQQAHSSKQLSRALWEAARHGKSAIAKWLVERQIVHPNESHTHVPALYTAVWDQREEIVGLLLEYGADPLLRYEKGFHGTPWKMVFNQPLGPGLKYPKYNFAIFKRMFDSIERLHKETPDIESFFGYDWKLESLLEALRANWDEASHFLIRCGANDRLRRTQRADIFVNPDERQSSTLQIAVNYSRFSVIEALLDLFQKRSSNLATQAITSVQLKSSEHLEYINYSDNHGRSAIHYLMDRQSSGMENKEEIMGLLLKHGADPTAVSDKKHTAIHIAAAIGSTNMIRHLTAEGLDLEARDLCGATALHVASGGSHRKPQVIGYLTDNGQEPLERNSAGSTPLHYAAKSCNLPALEALLEILLGRDGLSLPEAKRVATARNLSRSANKKFDSHRKLVDYVNVADDEGNSLLHVVGTARNSSWLNGINDEQITVEVKDTVRLLVNLGATLNSKAGDKNLLLPLLALSRRSEYGAKISAKELLNQGADPNIPDSEGATALHYRIRCWDDELVEDLLNAGVNIEAKDKDSCTPLHWACRYSGPRTVKRLLLHDADCHARDYKGQTPLHSTAQSIHSTYEMTAMLIQKGADVQSADHSGATPLHLAAKAGNTNTVWVFIRYDANPEAVDINGKTAMHYAAEQASITGEPERVYQSHLATWLRLFNCSEKWCQRNKTRPRTLFKRARSQILRTDHSWGDFSQMKSETLARP